MLTPLTGTSHTHLLNYLDRSSLDYRDRSYLAQWQQSVVNQQRLGDNRPKLVCINVQPYKTTQAPERADILNSGGFSDAVFSVVASFLRGDSGRFVAEVEAVQL